MMNKITLLPLVAVLSYSSFVHAGGMGCSNSSSCSATSFFALEGGYSWNTIDGYTLNLTDLDISITSKKSLQGYTGRLSAGMLNMLDDDFALSGEVGWGYYGKTTLNPSISSFVGTLPASLSISKTLSGFDALLGAVFVQPGYSLYIKAGALIQNVHTKTNGNFGTLGVTPIDNFEMKSNSTTVLPEVKIGGGYNFNENWSLNISCLAAIGSKQEITGNFNVTTGDSSLDVNNQNPSIGAVLLGVQYTI